MIAMVGLSNVAGLAPESAAAVPAWSAPVGLSAINAERPAVAVDAQGDAVAVWQRYDGNNWIVEAASRVAGRSWQHAIALSAPGENAERPQLAIDTRGDAVAVWERSNGQNEIVESSSRRAGGTWQKPVALSAPGANAGWPQVALDTEGEAVAVWQRFDGATEVVESTSRRAGRPWQPAVQLSAPGGSAERPRVALDARGDGVVVWERYESGFGGGLIIEASSRRPGGSWQEAIKLSPRGMGSEKTRVAVDPHGDAIAVWQCCTGETESVYGSWRTAGGPWGEAVRISVPGANSARPQVGLDSLGDAVVVWERSVGEHVGEQEIVEGTSRPVRGSWQKPVALSPAGRSAEKPEVAMNSLGDATAVWEGSEEGHGIVESAWRPARGLWQPAAKVSSPGLSGEEPQVALSAPGVPVAVWVGLQEGSDLIEAAL